MPLPDAVKVALVVVQVSTADEGLTLAVGGVVSLVTLADAVAVQPFEPVTVTV